MSKRGASHDKHRFLTNEWRTETADATAVCRSLSIALS